MYHPQTDGLVERFHRTLTDMLAKTVAQGGKDWDQRLQYVLFMYRSSPQSSVSESLFCLLYGKDSQLTSESILEAPKDKRMTSLVDYKGELTIKLNDAWQLAWSRSRNRKLHRNSTMTHLQMSIAFMWEIKSMCTHQQRKWGLFTNLHIHLWLPTGRCIHMILE